jgi:beta-lactamase regulating signal transducer with metallopeptidase domain/uncharacterized GH25 family protein
MGTSLTAIADYLVSQSWQILVVFAVVAAACCALRKASAHWRYLLWLVVLAKCLAPGLVSVPLPVLPQKAEPHQASSVVTMELVAGSVVERDMAANDPSPTVAPLAASQSQLVASSDTDAATTLPMANLTLRDWAAIAWIVGVALFVVLMSQRAWTTQRRLQRTRRPADAEVRTAVAAAAERLGLRKLPTVYMADGIAQPFVWGWLRGDIYLPQQFAGAGTRAERQAILAHEIAHVARWDAAANLVQIIAQAVFFFHPVLWWTNRQIRREREKCCDEIVIAGLGANPRQYGEAIVNALVAEYEASGPIPSLAVAGGLKNIEERIKTILNPERRFYRRPSWLAVATVMLLAACAVPTALVLTARGDQAQPSPGDSASQPASKPATDAATRAKGKRPAADAGAAGDWKPGQVLDIRVINSRTQEPLPGVKLKADFWAVKTKTFDQTKIQTTDAKGRCEIRLPDWAPDEVRIYPTKTGFVPLFVYWGSRPGPPDIPKTATIPMEPGTIYGGVVQDEKGEPIPAAIVTVHYTGESFGGTSRVSPYIDTKVTTDKKGRWRVDFMPSKIIEDELRIFLTHPDFVSDQFQRSILHIPITKRPPIEKLKAETALMVMRKGTKVEGRVVDGKGRPIAGAAIYDRMYYWFDDHPRAADTDRNGQFRLPSPRYGKMILVVQATGYSPELIEADATNSPLSVSLRKVEPIEGRVVDENGNPIEGVSISLDRSQQHNGRLNLSTVTNAKGEFRLADAPRDGVTYDFRKEGYMSVEDFEMSPAPKDAAGRQTYLIKMKQPLRIVGSIVDAETGRPLSKCTVIWGWDRNNGPAPSWQRLTHSKKITDGRYEWELTQEWLSSRLRVEADGYMPAVSRLFKPGDKDKGRVTYDFKLKKSPPMSGTVLGLDGKPLVGAEVFLATEMMLVNDRKAASHSVRQNRMVRTDAAGKFQFPPEVEPFNLVVLHDNGRAVVTEKEFAKSPTVRIEPWTADNSTFRAERSR